MGSIGSIDPIDRFRISFDPRSQIPVIVHRYGCCVGSCRKDWPRVGWTCQDAVGISAGLVGSKVAGVLHKLKQAGLDDAHSFGSVEFHSIVEGHKVDGGRCWID